LLDRFTLIFTHISILLLSSKHGFFASENRLETIIQAFYKSNIFLSGMSTPNSTSEELEVQIAVLQQLLNQKGFTSIESTIAEDGIRLDHYESNLH